MKTTHQPTHKLLHRVNHCPSCGHVAMGPWSKIIARSLTCQHCGTPLRLQSVPTAAIGLGSYAAVLFVGSSRGINLTSIIVGIGCLATFFVASLFMPLEATKQV